MPSDSTIHMTQRIDILNFFLIWLTLLFAFSYPFELFLFSYIVLGPLHYMTEINWLNQKDYFLEKKTDRKGFLIIGISILFIVVLGYFINELGRWDITKTINNSLLQFTSEDQLVKYIEWSSTSLFIAVFFTFIYHLTSSWPNRILLTGLCFILSFFYFKNPTVLIWFGVFLPTIVHVYLFTLLFMWFGTKKTGSGWGKANIVSMFLVILIIVGSNIRPIANSINPFIMDMTVASNFHAVNYKINEMFGLVKNNKINFYAPYIWKAQIFLAFAYTYHYLNWFSKTSIIKWHKIEKKKLIAAVSVWIVAVTLYTVNFRAGSVALFVLSALHVILEFPLNMLSIKEVTAPLNPFIRKRVGHLNVKK